MQEEESTPAFQRWLEYRSRAPSQDAKLASVYCCNVYLLPNLTLISNPALISSNHPKASSEIFFSYEKLWLKIWSVSGGQTWLWGDCDYLFVEGWWSVTVSVGFLILTSCNCSSPNAAEQQHKAWESVLAGPEEGVRSGGNTQQRSVIPERRY